MPYAKRVLKAKRAPPKGGVRSRATKARASTRRARAMSGAGLFDWVSKAFNWIKDNKVVSTIGDIVSSIPGAHPLIGTVTGLAKSVGLGRKRGSKAFKRQAGGAIRLSGAGVSLAGGSNRSGRAAQRLHILM